MGDSAALLFRRRLRWACVAAVVVAIACNTYDESLVSTRDAGHAGGSAGASTTIAPPPADASSGGSGGSGGSGDDDAHGGAGTMIVADAPSGSPDVTPAIDAPPGSPDVATVDVRTDTPSSSPDVGAGGSGPVDARNDPTPIKDAQTVVDADAAIVGESLIDDMEDPDDAILVADGRRGGWFVLNDGTDGGVQNPAMGAPFTMTSIPGARGASTYAAHTSGQGFTTWSALFGFWLKRPPAALKQVYDASKYNALTFWARTGPSDSAAFSTFVRVQLPDKDTDPDGQVCTADGSAGCSDHFGKTIQLTSDWVKYTVKFNSLQQSGFGFAAPSLDAAHVYGVEFQFPLGSTFDCWIDDIAFASL